MKTMQPHELRKMYGENVRARRKELGFTQQDVASKLAVTQAYVAAIEAGTSWPRISVFAKLAESLNTSPAALLSTDGIFSAIPS